ncbi:37S ribosomal protein RSM18, mitochondrial [Fulvia fulva]|uniref:Small ribosomal subunit protein bS18m n=1 Tax=Passalora fulva TaxID=5499 RepID=A0A9Q8UTF4_PASFU|nr:37S ribosomal protein RSM18, mitochondrial [Fulvia fulva]KAK4614169.1 37S ribosomal protein RSM18, mitochondrial [Fulvia fulva]KAK4614386.1 37S ribosomal protein RSM18, mitochondrial [Fulvia fulva]UJO21745.1 37S ribosomal protein RSM18, mitochondrial [Fulvia fulva]WPV19829.1 37S ribosomal protein RSM18, mitochondrial [Fulvia fulva]WPV35242.1 37S ribosomal protein RSM18, mitochondrial [Fulvia fulva]
MSLEHAFRRLAIRPSSVCRQCRRTIATSTQRQQQQSATGSFADLLSSSRDANRPMARRTAPTPTADRTATSPPAVASAPPPAEQPAARDNFALARQAVRDSNSSRIEQQNRQLVREAERGWSRKDLELQAVRKWTAGDVYSPHDLSGVEMSKWKKIRRKPRPKYDVIDQLGLDPLKLYRNFSIMSEYVTEMGRIKHSNDTGLRPVNQRKMAKAIRRSMGMGLMPGVHRHPEIIKKELENRRPSY